MCKILANMTQVSDVAPGPLFCISSGLINPGSIVCFWILWTGSLPEGPLTSSLLWSEHSLRPSAVADPEILKGGSQNSQL
jgi:hypothetical protein